MLLIHLWDQLNAEQRACVDAVVKQANVLSAEVTHLRNECADAASKFAALSEEKARMEESFRADFDRVSKELKEVADAGLAARNRLYWLTQHLPAILADWLAPFEAFSDAALVPEFVERRQQVRQLLEQLGLESI